MNASPTRTLRCAVYTRKSSEEGLDQAFNSLDAQREACQDSIKSQKHQGWVALSASYDDGGYSGGSTDRPGLQRLLNDIRAGRVDVVVVYKVDRLSRSLADFARLMQLFDEHGVSFVSVTQQFNTTSSMGRLTLNMLLSFAQFEREVAGERIRDKIAATFKKGIFVTGQPPLGYRRPAEGEPGAAERRLVIVEGEANLIRLIYVGYLELGSLVKLAERVNTQGHRTKRWTSSRGRTFGGRLFTAGLLYRILTNPIYIGKIAHTRRAPHLPSATLGVARSDAITELHNGLHEAIVPRDLWDQVQAKMAKAQRATNHRWTHTHLLKGKLRTCENYAMSPCAVQKQAEGERRKVVRYYVSQKAVRHGYASCPIKTLNAGVIDELVRALVLDHLTAAHTIDLRPLEPAARDQRIRGVIEKVEVAPDRVSVELDNDRIAVCKSELEGRRADSGTTDQRPDRSHAEPATMHPGAAKRTGRAMPPPTTPACLFKPVIEQRDTTTILSMAVQIKRHDRRRVLVAPDGADLLLSMDAQQRPMPNAHVVAAIGEAFAWRSELLKTGGTIEALAAQVNQSVSSVKQRLHLTSLSPAALRAALTGTLPARVTVHDLVEAGRRLDWSQQASQLGLRSSR